MIDLKTTRVDNGMSHLDKFFALLAEENITIVRSSTVHTAMFSTTDRVMTIPAFAMDDKDTFLTMGAHEVAHALWTPSDWYEYHNGTTSSDYNLPEKVTDVKDPVKRKLILTCINIVEDIRIERLIRRKYPGFVSIFNRGYEKLLGDGFFSLNHWEYFEIHDRVNVFAKIGKLTPVKLTLKEKCVYKYIQTCKTFQDVVEKSFFLANLVENDICNSPGESDSDDASGTADEELDEIIESLDGQAAQDFSDAVDETKYEEQFSDDGDGDEEDGDISDSQRDQATGDDLETDSDESSDDSPTSSDGGTNPNPDKPKSEEEKYEPTYEDYESKSESAIDKSAIKLIDTDVREGIIEKTSVPENVWGSMSSTTHKTSLTDFLDVM